MWSSRLLHAKLTWSVSDKWFARQPGPKCQPTIVKKMTMKDWVTYDITKPGHRGPLPSGWSNRFAPYSYKRNHAERNRIKGRFSQTGACSVHHYDLLKRITKWKGSTTYYEKFDAPVKRRDKWVVAACSFMWAQRDVTRDCSSGGNGFRAQLVSSLGSQGSLLYVSPFTAVVPKSLSK